MSWEISRTSSGSFSAVELPSSFEQRGLRDSGQDIVESDLETVVRRLTWWAREDGASWYRSVLPGLRKMLGQC